MSEANQRNRESAAFRRKVVIIAGVVLGLSAAVYLYSGIRYMRLCGSPKASCLEHRSAGCSINGNYEIKVGGRVIDATCDMKSDGGGWTLVGNYLHAGSKNSTSRTVSFNDRLPVQGATDLGKDETGSKHWGHAGTLLLSAIPLSEVRFSCKSSGHSRKVDFAVSAPQCLDYFKTGKGACIGTPEDRSKLVRGSRSLIGHDGLLPTRAEKGWKDQGENALVNYPFFLDWKTHWAVGAADNRWECDDYEQTGKVNTFHQIWVR